MIHRHVRELNDPTTIVQEFVNLIARLFYLFFCYPSAFRKFRFTYYWSAILTRVHFSSPNSHATEHRFWDCTSVSHSCSGNTSPSHNGFQGFLLLGQILWRPVWVQVSALFPLLTFYLAKLTLILSWFTGTSYCRKSLSNWFQRRTWWANRNGAPLAFNSRKAGSTTWSTSRSHTFSSFAAQFQAPSLPKRNNLNKSELRWWTKLWRCYHEQLFLYIM